LGYVAVGLLAPAVVAPSTASADTGPAGPVRTTAEGLVISAANDLSSWVSAHLLDHPWPAFARMYVDQKTDTLYIYGTEALPAGLMAEIERHRSSSKVVFVRSRYTQTQLVEEGQRLFDRMAASGTPLQSVRPDDGGNGLVVAPAEAGLAASTRRAAFATSLQTTMPVTVEAPRPGGHGEFAGRHDDVPRYKGGAAIFNSNGGLCTAGFPVFYGSSPNRQYGMVTAKHCRESFFHTASNRVVGRTHRVSSDSIDAQMLIGGGPGTQPYSNQVYWGPWNSGSTHLVRNGGNPGEGSIVCQSGAMTGERCSQRVDEVDVTWYGYGPGFWFENYTNPGTCAGQPGDSGAPVYFPAYSDNTVTIAGMVHGGPAANVTCPGRPDRGSSDGAGYWAFAIRISTVLYGLQGVGLVTVSSGVGGGHG
jgi:hypothetical protein